MKLYLVARGNKGTDEAGNNHHLIDKENNEDSGPWETGCQEQVEKQQRSGHEPGHNEHERARSRYKNSPIDVAHVEERASFTSQTSNTCTVTDKLNENWSLAEVGSHGEVGNGGDQSDRGCDVVEDTLSTRLAKGETDEGQGCHTHNCADSKVPEKL